MISQDSLKKILTEWSFWDKNPQPHITRKLKLPKTLHPDLVFVIQGVRRCGKSTLMTQLPQHYKLDTKNCYFCNFEDPRLIEHLDHTLLEAIVSLAHVEQAPNTPCYFFFDEIQEVQHWEKFLHQQLERPGRNHFIITGSNASLLSGELGSSLTGRHITVELFPFNFEEFQAVRPHAQLQDYFMSGGFPRVLSYENPTQLLQEYFSDILNRDVLARIGARSSKALIQVAKMAFETCGSELSYRKIAGVTQLTVDTVKSYLEAFEQAYLLFHCPFFSFSEKIQQHKNKKYYPIDPALRTAVTNTQNRDMGKALETLVFLRLKQKYKQVYYYSEADKGEVDFVVVNGTDIIPYQVSLNEAQPRHEKALMHFYQQYPNAKNPIFVNMDNAEELL